MKKIAESSTPVGYFSVFGVSEMKEIAGIGTSGIKLGRFVTIL